MILVHGDCPTGADVQAKNWAFDMNAMGFEVIVEPHPADWGRFGKAAGYRRNAEMVKLGADICLAFIYKKSPGATHTAFYATKVKIKTLILRED